MTAPNSDDQDGDSGHDDMPSRILDAAAVCFYRDGIYATGVDGLAAEAGISKRTLYNHFGSKDGVIAAYLRRLDDQWQAALDAASAEAGEDPVEQVVAYVHAYPRPEPPARFRGSAFMNAAVELTDEQDEALAVLQHSLDRMEASITAILGAAGYPRPNRLARLVVYLLEGAAVVGGARRSDGDLDDAEQLIRKLLEQQHPAQG
jgi:AcrR family transcriptional regulator